MVKKLKQKNIPKTIYFEPEVLKYIEDCMPMTTRKISEEVNHGFKMLRKIREKNNLAAINMADEHFKDGQDNQPQT